jgi:tRNA(Glu) U13 pseudouridine synthase TruD
MPKLDGTHIADRLKGRLDELLRGDEVATRDLRALLNDEQAAAMDAAWAEQQMLRKQKRARNKAEEIELGWKSKREIHIEALQSALNEAREVELAAWEKRLFDIEVRQGRVFFDELSKQRNAGVDMQTAKTRANNALTRAGLKRLDGAAIGAQGLNARDKEIRAMEDAILAKAESELDDFEREQLELLREHEKAVLQNNKKRGW